MNCRNGLVVGMAALAFNAGCASRGTAFRFGNPMLASASADPQQSDNQLEAAAVKSASIRQVQAPVIRQVIAPRVADIALPTGDVGRPAPHRQGSPLMVAVDPAVVAHGVTRNEGFLWLRQRVGLRTKLSSLSAVQQWRTQDDGALVAANATILDLVNAAAQSSRWMSAATLFNGDVKIRVGDLIVFDRTEHEQPATLIALCVATDDRGVSEFFYVAGGVVRRGFIAPTRATLARDEKRRVLNTYLRHNRDWPPKGTRFLSGELLRGIIR
jgi:hypothetical protein